MKKEINQYQNQPKSIYYEIINHININTNFGLMIVC